MSPEDKALFAAGFTFSGLCLFGAAYGGVQGLALPWWALFPVLTANVTAAIAVGNAVFRAVNR